MKKNKYIANSVRKQKLDFIAYNLLSYILVFVILGIITVSAVDNYFYKGAKEEIRQEVIKLELTDFAFKDKTNTSGYRKMVLYYDSKGRMLSGDALSYIPRKINVRYTDVIRPETFEVTGLTVEQHHYLTLLIQTNDPEYPFAKIFVNIDGEYSARNTVITVYLICVSSFFVLSIIASYMLSSKTIKPIMESLEKQLNFVSDASHELRTPLAIVQSKIENILTDSDKTVYDVSEDLAISLKELSRLAKLTNDLLLLARNDKDNLVLELDVMNINDIIKDAIEPFSELAILQDKKFTYNGIDVNTRVDRNKIYQMMIILLDNALSYTNPNDDIEVVLSTNNNEVIIEVKDTGIGISDYSMSRVFERFYREDKARNRDTGGNGLGLSIAKAIVVQHRGKINVEHNSPKGTVFTVTIPKIK